MKIVMIMVASADGKTTKGDDKNIYTWSSRADQKYFFSLIKQNHLIVMGRGTYEAARSMIRLEKDRRRIILTRYPKKYLSQTVKGKLEFSNETPARLVKRLSKAGYKKILLVGGSSVNGSFLKAKLVDEFYLTIEPKIFAKGKYIVDGDLLDVSLKLMSVKKINKSGSLLLKYKIKK